MQLLSLLALSGLASTALARSAQHVGKKLPQMQPRAAPARSSPSYPKRAEDFIVPQNNQTTKFAVNGTAGAIPFVDFDIGESYAGLLPISSAPNSSELYFWFFPSQNTEASDEILIWLNGGPGCSSLEGFLQENGPILWQYGTFKPVYNPWTWGNLTNIVWVEQPVGTGFTQGTPTAASTEEAAQQFLGFFKNFVDTFSLQNRKVYITGESYAGMYVPYFAEAMLESNDTEHFDVKGIMIYDPSIATDAVLEQVPSVALVDKWADLFNFNETFLADIHDRADSCGYTEFLETYLTFPPPAAPFPQPKSNGNTPGCDLWDDIFNAAMLTNPCWDVYAIATTCPLLWDVLGFPGSFDYVPDGAFIYFNRSDVQAAINAPQQEWAECSNGVLDHDKSQYTSYTAIPKIIDSLDKTIIVHGELDFILLYNGTLLAIQNMTWGGEQGFQEPPTADFFVPYHDEVSLGTISAAGVMGNWHTERKLTYVQQRLSGHMVPQYQPSSAYRQLEFLLGRIEDLSSTVPFSGGVGGGYGNKTTARRGVEDVRRWY